MPGGIDSYHLIWQHTLDVCQGITPYPPSRYDYHVNNRQGQGAGAKAQWLRTLAVLAEDLGPIPNIHVVANNFL